MGSRRNRINSLWSVLHMCKYKNACVWTHILKPFYYSCYHNVIHVRVCINSLCLSVLHCTTYEKLARNLGTRLVTNVYLSDRYLSYWVGSLHSHSQSSNHIATATVKSNSHRPTVTEQQAFTRVACVWATPLAQCSMGVAHRLHKRTHTTSEVCLELIAANTLPR